MIEPEFKFKVFWNGREWRTRSPVDAKLLVDMLQEWWPDATVEVWEQFAVGFTDDAVSVDGHAWRPVTWDGGGLV